MSGSDYTQTPNLGLYMPVYDMDDGNWGFHLNDNAQTLDSVIHALQSTTTGGPFLPLSGGTVAPPLMTGTAFDAALYITSTAQGSGTNGPGTAQIGLNINHQKPNYLTTTNVGEIDGLYVTVCQGGPGSDCGGILVDVTGTGSGFLSIDEGVVKKVNSSGTTLQAVRVQTGGLNPASPQYTGQLIQAQTGTLSQALLINDVPGQGSWANFIEGWLSGSQNFVVYNSGGVFAAAGYFTPKATQVQGVPSSYSSPGGYLTWNHGGDGATWLLTNQGGGSTGGIVLGAVTSAGVASAFLALYGSAIYFGTGAALHFSNGAAWNMPTDLVNAANDAAAGAAGVPVGVMYRNGSALMMRVV